MKTNKKRYKYFLKHFAENECTARLCLNYDSFEECFMLHDFEARWNLQDTFEEGDPLLESVNLDMFDKIEVNEK